jgi:ATP-dependent helicase/nuclease subunit A
MKLSPEQLSAIRRDGQDVCVVAGPGSGKTTVLIERFAWLVDEKNIDPARILAITFTEKAATEIKSRLIERFSARFEEAPGLRDSIERAWVSTIHGFCARLLRENAIAAGLAPDFGVLDQPAADRIAREAAEQALDEMFAERAADMRSLFDALDLATDDFGSKPDLARSLLEVYEAMRVAGLNELPAATETADAWPRAKELAEIILQDRVSTGADVLSLRAFAKCVLALADGLGREHFETLLECKFHLGRVGKNARALAAAKELKNEIVPMLERQWVAQWHSGSASIVRDAIARIRELIRQKKREESAIDFAGLEEETIRLLENNPDLRERTARRFDEILMDELQDTNPLQWRLMELIRRRFFAVGDINQSIYGFRYAEPAVFAGYRTRLMESGGLIDELLENRRSVPAILDAVSRVLDGQPGIEPRELIPTRADEAGAVDLMVALGDEATGVEAAEVEASMIAARIRELIGGGASYAQIAILVRTLGAAQAIERALDRFGIPFLVSGGRTFLEAREILDVLALLAALVNPLDEIALVGVLRSPLMGVSDEEIFRTGPEGRHALFTQAFGKFRPMAGFVAPDLILAKALDECGYIAGLSERARANVEKLLAYLRREHRRKPRPLAEWLDDLEALRETQSEAEAPPPEAGDVVRVMTIHAAKGLEFPIVFVSALHRGTDQTRPVIAFSPAAGLGAKWRNPVTGVGKSDLAHLAIIAEMKERDAAEENRLLYVAMTRAKNRLILSYAEKRKTNWVKLVSAAIAPTSTADQVIDPEMSPAGELAIVRLPDVLLDPPAHVTRRDGSAAVTAVALFHACPRKYLLSTIMNPVAKPTPEFDEEGGREFGTDVHRILAGEEADRPTTGAAEMAQRFSASELGRRATRANRIEREFDFLFYFEDVVLRGQIDLWFEEAGELIVVDYKTDREESPEAYALQLQIYALALERYAGRVADRAILFYLRQDKAVEIAIDSEQVRSAVRAFLATQDSLEYPLNAGQQCLRCGFFGNGCVGTGAAVSSGLAS